MAPVRSDAIGVGVSPDSCTTTPRHDSSGTGSRREQNAHENQSATISAQPPTTAAANTAPTHSSTFTSDGGSARQARSPMFSRPDSTPTEADKLHAAVAAGHLPAVEAYIAQHTAKNTARTRPASGLSAMLAVSGVGGAAAAAGTGALEVRDRRGRTPLHTACEKGRTGVVRALIGGGANVNATDHEGFRPLHRCARAGGLECARAILEARHRWTGSEVATGVHVATLASLPTADADVETLHQVDVDAPASRGGYSPLHLACLSSSSTTKDRDRNQSDSGENMVMLLLKHGADTSASDKWGCTPLHRACLEGNLEAASAVLNAGADVNANDQWRCTPLHRACHGGHAEIASLLVKRGASLSARDDESERPGQRFDEHVSAEQREAVSKALAVIATHTPAILPWSRSRSVDTASTSHNGNRLAAAGSSGRYIPPAARRALSVAALDGRSTGDADNASGIGGGAPLWRPKTMSNWKQSDSGPDLTENDGKHGQARDCVDNGTAAESSIASQPWQPTASAGMDGYTGNPSPDVVGYDGRATATTHDVITTTRGEGRGAERSEGPGDGGVGVGAVLRAGRIEVSPEGPGLRMAVPTRDGGEEFHDGRWVGNRVAGARFGGRGARLTTGGLCDLHGVDVFPPGDDWG